MRARSPLTLLAAGAVLAVPAAAADAATYPSVSKVEPLNLAIGEKLTVRGKGFRPGKGRNTVVFKRDGKRAIFAKAARSTRTRLKVVVPEKLRPFLAVSNGTTAATRFRIRILAKRFGKRYTSLAKSPRIAPLPAAPGGGSGTSALPDCDRDGQADAVDLDDDDDTLSDEFEAFLRTNPCEKDSDGDGMWDVWEYEAAIDLNSFMLPYPGKRPHPNPLDGQDAKMDYDGDGLWMHQEHALWQAGGRPRELNYSDGDQDTGGMVPAPGGALAHLDFDGDGSLSDDERDFDGDRLPNWVEANGPLQPEWWTRVDDYKDETPYFNVYEATSFVDADSDGDGRLDGDDDQDYDGFDNVRETWRGPEFVHPFNPCLPSFESRTCATKIPFGMDPPYPPFDGRWKWDHDLDSTTPLAPRPVPLDWPLLDQPPAP